MSMIPLICCLIALLCLLVCIWSLGEVVILAHRVRAALDEMRERQDLFFESQRFKD